MKTGLAVGLSLALIIPTVGAAATGPESSLFDLEQQKIRYDGALAALDTEDNWDNLNKGEGVREVRRKSPAKAFLLSLAVPGLGQYYYGSRVKPFLFLGVEVATWTFHFKWHGEGDDITAEFEAFHREHWLRSRYEDQYLLWAYGVNDDDSLYGAEGITHHLPDTETQQYFEMTGKYDQFAWGWEDATLNGMTLDEFGPPPNAPPRIFGAGTAPSSAYRDHYEARRNDANLKYRDANTMLILTLVNHLVSAFEAYFATKSRNAGLADSDSAFGRVKVRTGWRSLRAPKDTPFVRLSYRF
jgi:hypothetical protein